MPTMKTWFFILLAVSVCAIVTSDGFYDLAKDCLDFIMKAMGWPTQLQD